MVIYIWKDGDKYKWGRSWEINKPEGARSVDLDRWFEYDLNELEVLACLEALGD